MTTERSSDPAPRGTRRTLPARIALALGSLLFAFVLAEVALRIVWENPYRNEGGTRFVPLLMQHDRTDNRFNRKLIAPESPTVRFRSDERGYILPSRRFDHPDATIAFVGGSTTECSAVVEELRYPALVSTLLEAKGVRVDALNAGTSGDTTHDVLNIVLNHVVDDHPDVIVLMEAINDVGMLSGLGSYGSRMAQTQTAAGSLQFWAHAATRRSSVGGLLRRVVVTPSIGAAHAPVTAPGRAAPLPVVEYDRRLRAFVGIVRAFGAVPVLMTQPLSTMRNELTPGWVDRDNQDAFNDRIRKVGAETQTLVIDLAKHLQTEVPGADEPMKLFYDGLHVTDQGSRVYAAYVAAKLLDAGVVGARKAP